MKKKTLSICLTGRNDNYSLDFNRRLEQLLNFLAYSAKKGNVLDAIEVVLTDWNSDVPLISELSLSKEACGLLKTVIVPPEIANNYNWKDTPFHGTNAINVAVRRSSGRFIAVMPGDILIPEFAITRLIKLLNKRDNDFYNPEETLFAIPIKNIPFSFSDEISYRLFVNPKYNARRKTHICNHADGNTPTASEPAQILI